jgi:hypothetical protein
MVSLAAARRRSSKVSMRTSSLLSASPDVAAYVLYTATPYFDVSGG